MLANWFVMSCIILAMLAFQIWFLKSNYTLFGTITIVEVKKVLKSQRLIDIKIPSLYIMGAEDSIFLPSVKKAVLSFTNAQLSVIESSGHVVNVDQPVKFNERVIKFLNSLDLESSNWKQFFYILL